MSGIELAVGYLFAWVLRKGKRVAGKADQEVDQALDVAMDRLHELVNRKLGSDPALVKLAEEAASGPHELSDRTRARVRLALEEVCEHDSDFALSMDHVVSTLNDLSQTAGGAPAAHQAVSGNVEICADHGSAAAWNMGSVTLGNPPTPEPNQG